jgi:hypothetical protein
VIVAWFSPIIVMFLTPEKVITDDNTIVPTILISVLLKIDSLSASNVVITWVACDKTVNINIIDIRVIMRNMMNC